jgi:Holliday junction resolvase RusA-like endonuclease
MTEPIIIRITGHAVPQGRPKATVFAGHARIYKPAKSRRWEEDARQEARIVMAKLGIKPLTGVLQLDLSYTVVPSRSWPAWKIEAALAGMIYPTGKPDVSNVLKAAEDALNGIVWIDDSQVVRALARKSYGEQPEVVVIVQPHYGHSAQITKRSDLSSGDKSA